MIFLRLILLPAMLVVIFAGAAQKEPTLVRFHVVAADHETEPFVMSVNVGNPPRKVKLQKMPVISEREIKAFHPFPAVDGTNGVYFQLDPHGTKVLESATRSHRGGAMVAILNGRGVIFMRIDRPVNDGLVVIPAGLSSREIVLLGQRYALIGETPQQTRVRRQNERKLLKEALESSPAPANPADS